MVTEQRLDRVIVTTPDHTHAAVVSEVLRAGADVVVEKPLAIDEAGLRLIGQARQRSGREVVTTFNYRYSPRNSALREVVAQGRIGAVTSVHFEWLLDTVHGADYFRRWHRDKGRSGGLLVHKASHHFDLVNWWLGARATRVYARGGLRFYGAENARRRGLGLRPARGTGSTPDPFSLDLRRDPRLQGLYLDAERHDGYIRDADPFAEGITIEDNLSAVVDYDDGATLTYALNAHSPWEGYRVAVNGLEGRAELEVVERGAVAVGPDGRVVLDPSAAPDRRGRGDVDGDGDGQDDRRDARPGGEHLLVQRHWEPAVEIAIATGAGGHGGGDAYLLEHLFRGVTDDPLGRPAGFADGVRAVAVGIAGNRSLVTGQPVAVADLDLPDD